MHKTHTAAASGGGKDFTDRHQKTELLKGTQRKEKNKRNTVGRKDL